MRWRTPSLPAIAFSFSFSWTVNASDYCRYLPEDTSARRLVWSVFAGITAGCVLIEVLGLAAANILAHNVSQMKSLFDLVSGGALGYAVMVAICIGVIANLTATNYSAALELLSTGLRVRRPLMTGVSAALAFRRRPRVSGRHPRGGHHLCATDLPVTAGAGPSRRPRPRGLEPPVGRPAGVGAVQGWPPPFPLFLRF